MEAGDDDKTKTDRGTSDKTESDFANEQKQKGKCPRGVSDEMWQRFQKLKGKRQKVSHTSTQKRIRALQTDIMQKVKAEMCSEEEINMLKDNDVKLDEPKDVKKPRKRNHRTQDTESNIHEEGTQAVSSMDPCTSKMDCDRQGENWSEIQKYLGCNDHLKGIDKGRYAPKSKLEEKLDEAVSRNDFKTAEELSDKLAARDFGTKITEAIDAKRYADRKKREDDIAKAKRRKKLPWGFSEKHRWETKSNM